MKTIGSVSSIVRYPVKSMAGQPIDSGFLGFAGLFGDRVYAFFQEAGREGFPWLTIRQLEDLVLYKARFRHSGATNAPVDIEATLGIGPGAVPIFPDESAFDVEVETPSGQRLPIRDAELIAHLESEMGCRLLLRFSERSHYDCRPLSLLGNATVSALETELGVPLDARRFRANLYVEWDDEKPFYEDELVGRVLQIGERCRVMLTERDPRCKIITVDPDTAETTPKILRHVSNAHQGATGVYGAVLLEGMVHVGDPIRQV
jgi:uncharacterized protein YcbX